MTATRIKVTVDTVDIIDDDDLLGAGEWAFTSNVKRLATSETIAFGDSNKEFEVNTGDKKVNIGFSTELDIKKKDTKLEINLSAIEKDTVSNSDMGKIRIVLNTPICHDYDLTLSSDKGKYTARIKVEILKRKAGSAGAVTTILRNSGSSTFNTVHSEMQFKNVHIHPVTPVPWTTGIPPIPIGVVLMTASPQVDFSVKSGDPLNGLINPSFIVTMKPTDKDFNKKVARVKVTQFWPATLDLSKLVWKAVTGNIKFWNGSKGVNEIKGGQEVKVYGTNNGADQECKIEVRWDSTGGPLLAVFRAWVGKPKYVWSRANLIKTTATMGPLPLPNPNLSIADIKSHIEFANVILWQAGIQMVMDEDDAAYNGAVKKDKGIFEINSATNYTYNVVKDANMVAPLLNARKGVFNMAYIHSVSGKPGLLGSATDRRLSKAEAMVSFSGSPSTSWVQPSGVRPDGGAGTVKMKRMGPSAKRSSALKSNCGDGTDDTLNNVCACIMTQNVKARLARGNITLPHELGHVLGLHHRGNGGGQPKASYDKVNHKSGPRSGWGHPFNENFMCYGSDARRQDIDMIQVKVLRENALLKDTLPAAKKTPPKPGTKPVPTAWLPSKADIELLQAYLAGAKPGLKNTGYDLGSTGPNGDGVDGINGPKTKQAIRDFQRDHGGLSKDGIYGPLTHDAFDNELNGP